MLANLELILEIVDNPLCLLLEGSTGIGKTAIVMEAARRLHKPIIRYNMSSTTTIANLFGSSVPTRRGGKTVVSFKEGAFTLAFRTGAWLLLDEMNLAPESVLSSIENAIDMGILVISAESGEEQDSGEERRVVEFQRHPNFRMFCTQNPSSGFYKGRREEQSAAMLSRYAPVTVEKPTDPEFKQIIKETLLRKDAAQGLSLIHI